MKLTIKKINEQVLPQLQNLKDEALRNKLIQNVNAEFTKTNAPLIQERIRDCDEELRVIELRQTRKKLQEAMDKIELDVEPVEVEDMPEGDCGGLVRMKDIAIEQKVNHRPKQKKK